jgi:hypothetical protein
MAGHPTCHAPDAGYRLPARRISDDITHVRVFEHAEPEVPMANAVAGNPPSMGSDSGKSIPEACPINRSVGE